ncbi:MAG: hypothetical protein HFJ45_04440 [Clostridia bacterium]|nr:hypothetical protein [Clostridia bacterium]
MDSNNYDDICCMKPRKKRCCGEYILGILVVALAAVIGLILGAVFSAAILTALSALIVLIVMLVLLIIIRIISFFCRT